jgi:lipopolysaccharide/colanic/teichoic acid biosynthesis glycosyltransferase/glycosyltransferase involved in cell wall biosynthesis
MRVIYLHQYFNTPDMSGGTRSYEMARRLVASGHDVHMVTTWREPTDQTDWFVTKEAGITVHWLPLPYSNHMAYRHRIAAFLRFAWASSRKAASLPGDIVFATSTPLTIALPGIYAARRRRVPLVFEVRDLWPDVPIAMGVITNPIVIMLARMLERLAYRNSARVVALAPGMKEAVSQRGIADEHVHVVPNGCDFDLFDDPAIAAVSLPGSRDGATAVLYLGTMGVANGVDYIPRLAAEIRRRAGRDLVRFYLIGDGNQRAYAEAVARESGVLDRSVFFVGSVSKRDAARWLAAADATIITYQGPDVVFRDSVSNKFFDSIAAGRPVIANYSGFSTLLAAEAGAGCILNRDPDAGAEELLATLQDPTWLRRAGAAARTLAKERFSRDTLAAALEHVLVDAVSTGPQPEGRRVDQGRAKRLTDITLTAGGAALLAPVFVLLIVLVRVRLGAPVFFVQTRPGLHARPFRLVKFRTMTNAREASDELLPDAARLPPFGRFLRSTSLDELPELWNVLKGDMSLVGPRPLLMEYLPLYTPEQARRHGVRPGITGWAQVNGRNAITWEQKFALDVWYVDHRSMRLDLKILWRTLANVLGREGVSAAGEATMPKFTGSHS